MLDLEEFVEIGYIRKGHGYKGHARIVIFEEWLKDLQEQDFIFVEIDGYKVPFYIEERSDQKGPIIKLEHIDSSEELTMYVKRQLFLLKKDIRHAAEIIESKGQKAELVGYQIHDKMLGNIGVILRIDEYPQQEMGVIEGPNNQEILIPLHPIWNCLKD